MQKSWRRANRQAPAAAEGLKCSEGQMNIVREMKWCSVQEYENPDDPIEKATQQTQTGLVF